MRVANLPSSASGPALVCRGFFAFSLFWTGTATFSTVRAFPLERNRPGTSSARVQEVSPGFKRARLGNLALPVPSGWTLTQAEGDYEVLGQAEGVRAYVFSRNTPALDLALLAAAESKARTLGTPAVLRRIKCVSLPAGTAWLVKFRVGASQRPGNGADGSTDCLACLLPHGGQVSLILLWAPHGTEYRQRWQTMLQGLYWL